jgi:hypothetical protein
VLIVPLALLEERISARLQSYVDRCAPTSGAMTSPLSSMAPNADAPPKLRRRSA